MRLARRNRLITALALFALFFATSAFLAHEHDIAQTHGALQCDLCLQFSGTAGAPEATGVAARPVLSVRVPPAQSSQVLASRRFVGARLPRAPPADDVI